MKMAVSSATAANARELMESISPGDASTDVQFVIVAAAEGASAGVGINSDLHREELLARLKTIR